MAHILWLTQLELTQFVTNNEGEKRSTTTLLIQKLLGDHAKGWRTGVDLPCVLCVCKNLISQVCMR